MRVTIIRDDNRVIVNAEGYTVDCTSLPADVHAVQWGQWGDASGEVEYRTQRCEHCGTRSKKPNADIVDFTPYQKYVDGWNVAKADAEAKKAEKLAALEKAKADAARPQN